MNEYEIYEANMKQVCNEIRQITEQIKKNGTASEQDYKRLDLLYHLKKSMLACHGMEHPEEFENDGVSGYRGRAANGRYVSRDSYTEGYNSGYNQGYSQATMNQMNKLGSNQMPYYPEPRRW